MKTMLITALVAMAAMDGVAASPTRYEPRDHALDLLERSGAHPRMISELMGRVHAKRQEDALSATNPIASESIVSDPAASESATAEDEVTPTSMSMNGTIPSDPVSAPASGSPTPTKFNSGFASATPHTTMGYLASSASAALASLKASLPSQCGEECAHWVQTNEDCANLMLNATSAVTTIMSTLAISHGPSETDCVPLLCDTDNFNGMVQCFNCLAPAISVPAEIGMSAGKAYGILVDTVKQGCGKFTGGQPKQTVKYTGSAMRSNTAVAVVAAAGAAVAGAVFVMI